MILRQSRSALYLCLSVLPLWAASAPAADLDRDGLTDAEEKALGTHPDKPDVFHTIITDGVEGESQRRKEGYDPTKDVVTIEFAHAGGNRYLWRGTFAEAPRLADTVFHLYVDADADTSTGRKGSANAASTGTDYMLSVVAGGGTSGRYAAQGERSGGPLVHFVTSGKQLIVSADVDLGRDEKGTRYSLYVLCHTVASRERPRPPMSDSTRRTLVSGVPLVDRGKIARPTDLGSSVGVDGTFGLDIVRRTLRRKDVLVAPYDKLACDHARVDIQTSRRFPHVRMDRGRGKVWTQAPKPGSYHVGFTIFDDASDERLVMSIDGRARGVAVVNGDNSRTWIYWLREPYAFRGGERVELAAAGLGGKHGVCNILFLPDPLEIRTTAHKVENMAAYTRPGDDGRATLSWVTTWPCATRLEYGPTAACEKVATEDRPSLVHRVVLAGLDPKQTYHARGVGQTRDGDLVKGATMSFKAAAAPGPDTVEDARTVRLTVRNPHDVAAVDWPITTGVPFPQGVLGSASHVRLTCEGKPVPAQIAATGYWLDNSVKWILVTFQANVPAKGAREYGLQFGRHITAANVPRKVEVRKEGASTVVNTGALVLRVDAHGEIVLPWAGACHTTIVAGDGKTYSTAGSQAQVTVEESGPIRAVVKTVANAVADDGAKSFRIEKRIEVYVGSPFVRVHHTFVVDRPEPFSEIEDMSFVVPASRAGAWKATLADGSALTLDAAVPAAHQQFDKEFFTVSAGKQKRVAGRIEGCLVADGPGPAVAVRSFWQQYPKAFAVSDRALTVGLCPDFAPGLYDKFPFEKEGHQLYYYLLGGRYRFKRGMAKTHELFLCLAAPEQREALCRLFMEPLLATADPEWYCASKAFYDVAPRDEKRFAAYEKAIDANLQRNVQTRERQHDYGLMNYGDWYGERGANWGNIEYDTQHAFLLEYIRSGNPLAFVLAHDTELHNRDVDTIHWSESGTYLGAVYVHQMGHVGGYYTKSVPGTLGIPRAGYSVSHAWAEGHFNHFFLTGDRRSYDTGKVVADFFIHKMLSRPYDFLSCRTPGWHLMINSIAYASTCDPYYLNASRVIVDRVIETQDREPRPLPAYQCEEGRTHQVGGWSRMMVPGHCRCEPRHRGNAGFMVAVLLSGLKYYHDVAQDPRVKDCIIRGAHYLLDECYSPEIQGFRYTSCPKTGYRAGTSPLMAEGVARVYLWTRDDRLKRVLTEALPRGARGSGYGKGFSMYYRVAPRVLADMAACGLGLDETAKAKPMPFRKPKWMKSLGPDRLIVVQAEGFTAQGGGECVIRDDRHAVWGTMITYWHRDVGHWLEWEFAVPADGRYAVRFRYGTAASDTRREFCIDGRVPFDAAKSIAFPATGGYGNGPRDWRYLSLVDDTGEEALLHLSKGKHRIRMANLNDGLGLDFIALVRVP